MAADARTYQVYQQAGLPSKSAPSSPRQHPMIERERHIQQEGCGQATAEKFASGRWEAQVPCSPGLCGRRRGDSGCGAR